MILCHHQSWTWNVRFYYYLLLQLQAFLLIGNRRIPADLSYVELCTVWRHYKIQSMLRELLRTRGFNEFKEYSLSISASTHQELCENSSGFATLWFLTLWKWNMTIQGFLFQFLDAKSYTVERQFVRCQAKWFCWVVSLLHFNVALFSDARRQACKADKNYWLIISRCYKRIGIFTNYAGLGMVCRPTAPVFNPCHSVK